MGDDGALHVAVLPWLAFGHLGPFLELSKALAKKGHHISFISTPRNIERLPKLPQDLSPLIDLVTFPLPHCDGLPADAESTRDITEDKMQCLRKAMDGLEGPLADFMERAAPDWIIYDMMPYWVPRVAARFGVGCIYFSIFAAPGIAFLGPPTGLINNQNFTVPEQLTVPPPWISFPSSVAFRQYEAAPILEFNQDDSSGVNDWQRLGMVLDGCQICAIRSCPEIHSIWFHLLEDLYQKPVLPIGLLPPTASNGKDEMWVGRDWLDKQAHGSTVYVAFGSEAKPSKEQLHELALGLEQSDLPFIWALRGGPHDPDMLPIGFEDRINGRGIVLRGWAPQLRILAHPSVGGFLTHGGWSSIVEALSFGKPLIFFPIFSEQGLNARDMGEKKIGLEVARDEKDGSFTRDAVAEALRLVMVEEDGHLYRANAKKMEELFGNQTLHDGYINAFARFLKNHKGQPLPPSELHQAAAH